MAIKIAGVDVINDDRELVLAKLTDINETISSTAVDVFVYDTSKDSDGGAWRHRTQHTSWYNEGASSTRGSRKEFPAVAVIVAESNKVTIYDGDDPSLPMWMVFDEGADFSVTTFIMQSAQLSSVTMRNAQLCVGDQTYDLYTANFISEKMLRYLDGGGGTQKFSGPIANRNSNMTTETVSTVGLINRAVNDVAMTVLPDAPTDPATGLPVPTIAVATDGGVSVIKDDGTVVDSLHTYVIGNCAFNNEGLFYAKDGGTASFNFASFADIAGGDGFGDEIAGQTVGSKDFDILTRPTELALLGETISVGGRVEGTGVVNGVALHAPDYTDFTKGMSALTTSSYTTGWMPGDIKLAALADTTAETVSGSELMPNGDFPSGLSDGEVGYDNGDGTVDGWTADNVTLAVVNNQLEVTGDGVNSGGGAAQTITTVVGKTYVFSVDYAPQTGRARIEVKKDNQFGSSYGTLSQTSASGAYVVTFVAQSTSTHIRLEAFDPNSVVLFDNVTLRLADPDRSVNGNGLGVHGSITKAAVATGADLVAYSGFSSSNYLEQPYNPDLDFGTGDFCVMAWVTYKSGDNNFIIDRCDSLGSTPDRWNFGLDASGLFQRCDSSFISISHTFSDGVRYFICGVRTGGVFYAYVNGVLVGSATQGGDQTDASQSYPLTVASFGASAKGDAPTDIALIRISGTAPTADQIAKIYNDERPLFQPSAKATLTGSSDAVTALAHDPDTDLLHVGTSGGRSVFQGLRRVDETATAVTTAISAVDGLVVEQ